LVGSKIFNSYIEGVKMKVNISVSNERKFKKYYSDIINNNDVSVSEDRVAFGVSDIIIIGL
jgi:hypothetical protein